VRSDDIGPGYRPLLAEDVLIFQRGTDILLYSGATGESRVFNETAALILSAADGKTTVEQIVAALCRRYDVDAGTAYRDVQAVLREGCRRQLLALAV
jgi:hypothetical protein